MTIRACYLGGSHLIAALNWHSIEYAGEAGVGGCALNNVSTLALLPAQTTLMWKPEGGLVKFIG